MNSKRDRFIGWVFATLGAMIVIIAFIGAGVAYNFESKIIALMIAILAGGCLIGYGLSLITIGSEREK